MSQHELDRRQFHHLTAAALGGLVAGATLGCGGKTQPVASAPAGATDKHLCRGLNECKGQGAGGKNDCRGQGDCATVEHHGCGGENTCKGLGGCGESVGANDCAGKGGCHVPLMESAWDTMRKRLEDKWTKASQKFGAAPPEKM
jgi:hypothetical protein